MLNLLNSSLLIGAATLFSSTAAMAQSEEQTPVAPQKREIQYNPDNWLLAETKNGRNFVHKASGGICVDEFRDLELLQVIDYLPDGTNSSCAYGKLTDAGTSKLTIYVYTAEGLTGPIAYNNAKQSIRQIADNSGLTVSDRKEEGRACHEGVIKPLGEAILGRINEEGGEGEKASLGLGLAMYQFDIPEVDGRPAQLQTSMLSVYQTGKWVVKTRVTVPESETSYRDACNYGGIASVALARVITRQNGPAIAPEGT